MSPNLRPNIFWLKVRTRTSQPSICVPTFTQFTTIVDTASARDVDLIVMGTHGRTGLTHVLMGSVAEKVVRLAACPVLVTRGTTDVSAA
jgi:hypothetical protein